MMMMMNRWWGELELLLEWYAARIVGARDRP